MLKMTKRQYLIGPVNSVHLKLWQIFDVKLFKLINCKNIEYSNNGVTT